MQHADFVWLIVGPQGAAGENWLIDLNFNSMVCTSACERHASTLRLVDVFPDCSMLTVTASSIEAVKVITPRSFEDSRGLFCETFNRKRFAESGISLDFVQDNQSSSKAAGTIRGLHFQSHPAAQDKLVRVLRGSIFDVAVDLRRSSPTYGKWVAETLSAENGKQLLVPCGFAHGFCTLEPDTHVLYKVTAYYSPTNDLGIAWDDPDLAIEWPVVRAKAILSDKDARLPSFRSLPAYFE